MCLKVNTVSSSDPWSEFWTQLLSSPSSDVEGVRGHQLLLHPGLDLGNKGPDHF